MKHWEKLLKRASIEDQENILNALAKLKQDIFPPDTIKLKGSEQYRTRIGSWRIFFHYDKKLFVLDNIERRDGHNY